MTLLLISSRPHLEQHAVALQLYRRRSFAFGNLEKVTLSPNVMAFPVQIFPLRLAILLLQLPLLLLDPTQLRNRKYPNGIEPHSPRCGDAHATVRGIDAKVNVLNVLERDIDSNSAKIEPGYHQYSC